MSNVVPLKGNSDYLTIPFPAEVWHGGKRYDSAEQVLLALLAQGGADPKPHMLEVMRDKFARNHDLGERLLEADASSIDRVDMTPTHGLWTADDARAVVHRVRRELAGQEVMRTGMMLATHGSLVLMGRESDLGEDLIEGARRAGVITDVPSDSPALTRFEEAMGEAIADKWGDVAVELFELGKTILLYLSMDGITDDEPEYKEAREEARRVLQESAERLELDDTLWQIIERHGSNPDEISSILREIVIAAFAIAEPM